MRFAYADPPYLGCALALYGDATYDDPAAHIALVERLCDEYPDGWALSCHTPTLRWLPAYCPEDIRFGAWVKPFAVFRPNVNPAYAWEPVIFRGGRSRERDEMTVRDWHSESIALKRGLRGAKPAKFGQWVRDLLNARFDLGDTLDDVFPGTGGVRASWQQLTLQEGA